MLIHEYLEFWADTDPTRPAIDDGLRPWTFGDLEARANSVAHLLRSVGVEDGTRFAVLAKNCIEWLAIYYGAFKVGAVPVPLNYRLAPPEWIHLVNDSASKMLLVQPRYLAAIDTVRERFDSVSTFISLGESVADWESYEQLLAKQARSRPAARVDETHDLYQMYTSGTTGLPKGAVLTHAAVDAQLTQLSLSFPLQPGEGVLTVMPLYHAGAAVSSMYQLSRGAHLCVMADFDATRCVEALDEQEIAFATFVPSMIQAMLVSVPGVAERKYSDLRVISYGASPIAEETLREAMRVFKCDFVQAYGMTETTAALTCLAPHDHRRALNGRPELLLSCGRPVVGTEVRIVDEDDHELPSGEVGEIVARGPQLMKGYWNLEEATSKALRGGWMHTGDAGYRDSAGYFYVSDRVKDMIVSGGENVYPREIENVIFEIPQVADCAVIGVPDERWGETIKAIVVVRSGAELTADEVIEWCRPRLAGFKRPRSVDFVEVLPRNASGKVLKGELRAPHWRGYVRGVS
jgi:acyl-CoA synthetase (AMP-forming)/AMP-acid ligase II